MADRCPLNVPGPFYTCGECLFCGAPEAEAPGLLAALTESNQITYFVRQPSTSEEIEQACNAIRVCCVFDLRYGGTDVEIIERLGNTSQHSDYVIDFSGRVKFVGRPPDPLLLAMQRESHAKWRSRATIASVILAATLILFAILFIFRMVIE